MHRFSISLGSRELNMACGEDEAAAATAAARLLEEEVRRCRKGEADRSLVEILALAGLNLASESPRLMPADGKSASASQDAANERLLQSLGELAEAMESVAAELAADAPATDGESGAAVADDQEL